MNRSGFYPEPPHISAAFFFEGSKDANPFMAVCEHVVASGATAMGAFDVIRADAFPHFAMVSDLAARLEPVQLDLGKENALEEWKRWLHAQEPTVYVVRGLFNTPHVGPVVVAFEPILEEVNADIPHPISVTTSGQLLAMPDNVPLSHRDRQQAFAVAQFLKRVFRSVCESLDPLYGSINVEANLPTPMELTAGDARVGTELCVSDRLTAADAELGDDLGTILTGSFTERWTNGLFFSGWWPFNPEGLTAEAPLLSSTDAARRLGQTLQRLS